MFHSPAVDDTVSEGAVPPTFDALLVGPVDDGGNDDGVAGDPTAANAFFWRTRAWLPPTKHQREGKTL